MKTRLLAGGTLGLAMLPAAAAAEPVLLISIDGLRPADVIEAAARDNRLPNLRRFTTAGSYATGVRGVLPTVTYPSHATLVTGASPANHGIHGNTTFDPMQINRSGWFWYASTVKAKTLWSAVAAAGLSTANVHWPVTVGASHIRWNLPQYWRTGHEDDRQLLSALATPGLVASLEADSGRLYAQGIDESIEGDENRAAFARHLIAREAPYFMTVYLTALDHEQHRFGPGSTEARAVLERLDGEIGKLVEAQLAAHPDGVIAVVSDHGFAAVDAEINLFTPFVDAGLIVLGRDGAVTEWLAMPWPSGGSAAIVLARPGDAALVARVSAVLDRMKANPAFRIARIADARTVAAAGANPQASFYIDFAPGASAGSFKGRAVLVSPAASKGTHGYFPDAPEMQASFFIIGKAIPQSRNLGVVDMRSIAPTLARILGVGLPEAEAEGLVLAP